MRRINKQNVFIFISILFIATLFFIYSGRLIYYKVFQKKKVDAISNLTERILNRNTFTKEDNYYYFKGRTNYNYVIYSSQLWQIVKFNDKELTLVSVKPITNLYYDNDYENSIINEYLTEDFYNILDKSLLLKTTTCINDIIENIDNCEKKYSNYVTLLSLNLYDKVGGINSYINNGFYTYLSNNGTNNYYIDLDGNIRTTRSKDIYGLKAVITIKNTDIISGTGIKNDPYVLDKEKTKLNEANVGSYLYYSNMLWRIIKNKDETRLICNETIDSSNTNMTFELDSNLYEYLNTEFVKQLDNKYLIESKFYNGEFNGISKSLFTKIYAKVGIPYLLDLYLNDINDFFLMTKSANSKSSYKVNSGYTSIANENYNIRPIISIKNNLKIKGKGTMNNPYVIEGELDEA